MNRYHIKCEERTVWEGSVYADSLEEAKKLAEDEAIKKSVFMDEIQHPFQCVEIYQDVRDGSIETH